MKITPVVAKLYILNQSLDSILLVKKEQTSPYSLPVIELTGSDFNGQIIEGIKQWLTPNHLLILPTDLSVMDQGMAFHVGVVADNSYFKTIELAKWFSVDSAETTNLFAAGDTAGWSGVLHLVKEKQKLARLLNIQDALKKSQKYLVSSCNILEDEWGWDHNLDVRKRVGIIGTALGLITLGYFPSYHVMDLLRKVGNTLSSKQLPSGGWGTRSMSDGDTPIVHSTAYALLALSSLGTQDFDGVIDRGLTWLKKANKNGGWGLEAQSKTQLVTPTTLSITALCKIDKSENILFRHAKDWLAAAQQPDGGWGCYPFSIKLNSKSTVAHTSRVVSSLIEMGVLPTEKLVVDGIKWILAHQSKEGVWENTAESEYLSDNSQRLEFKHAGQQQALIALQKAGIGAENPQLLNGLVQLLSMQDEKGGWPHELAPGHNPAWATYDSVVALTLAEESLPAFLTTKLSESDTMNTKYLSVIQNLDADGNLAGAHRSQPSPLKALWLSGLLFVFIMVALIVSAVYASKFINFTGLPFVLVFVLLAFILVIISIFRQNDRLSAKSFKEIIDALFKVIPFFSRTQHK